MKIRINIIKQTNSHKVIINKTHYLVGNSSKNSYVKGNFEKFLIHQNYKIDTILHGHLYNHITYRVHGSRPGFILS